MDCALRRGDRVRHRDGHYGTLDGVFADTVAFVYWEDQRLPSYERITHLSKAKTVAAERRAPSKQGRKMDREAEEEGSPRFPRSKWPRTRSVEMVSAV